MPIIGPLTGGPGTLIVTGVNGDIAKLVAGGGIGTVVTNLVNMAPVLDAVVYVDGYSTHGDPGGVGQFYWNSTYNGPSTPITVVPSGVATGAWCRALPDNRIHVTYFGAQGDGNTDDWAAIQAACDFNTLTSGTNYEVFLPHTNKPKFTGDLQAMTTYCISQPLMFDDAVSSGDKGNTTKVIRGAGMQEVCLMPTTSVPGNPGWQTWMGPLMIGGFMGQSTGLSLVQEGTSHLMQVNSSTNPYLNYADWDVNTLSGSFCFEFEIDPLTDFPDPTSYQYVLCSLTGGLDNVEQHQSMTLQRTNAFGSPQIQLSLIVGGTTYTFTSPAHTDLTASSVNVVTIDYNESATAVNLFLNGTAIATGTTAGTFTPKWYEEFCIGSSTYATSYPSNGFAFTGGKTFNLGKQRLSNISRYSANFTPNSAGWTCDANTKLLVDFSPGNQGTDYSGRNTSGYWIVARTGALSPDGSGRTNLPIWMWTRIGNFGFHGNCEVSDLYLFNAQAAGLFWSAANVCYTHHLNITAYRGVEWQNFSYPTRIDNCSLVRGGTIHGFGHSFGYWYAIGAQGNVMGPNMSSAFSPFQWHIVNQFTDLICTGCLFGGTGQGYVLICDGALYTELKDFLIDDEDGNATYADVLVASAQTVKFEGGFALGNNVKAFMKVGVCPNLIVNTWATFPEAVPLFSFGSAQNNLSPVIWLGAGGSPNVVDPGNPGIVMNPTLEATGRGLLDTGSMTGVGTGTFTPTGISTGTYAPSSTYIMNWTQFFPGMLEITDTAQRFTGINTGHVQFPTTLPGYKRVILNMTNLTVTFDGPVVGATNTIGTGVAIASQKAATLLSTGTGWRRLTADA